MSITKFKINNLTCEACVKLSGARLKKIAGVKEVRINLASGRAEVAAERALDLTEVNRALAGTNYAAIEL